MIPLVGIRAIRMHNHYDPGNNIIEQLVEGYRKLNERRRMIYCSGSIRDVLGGSEPVLKPAQFALISKKKHVFRMEFALISEFINSFHPFAKLMLDDRVSLCRNIMVSFAMLERFYRTMKFGGLQTKRIVSVGYNYIDLTDIDQHCEGVDKEKIDVETLKKIFIPPLLQALHELTGPMYHCGMTDVEFVALIAVLLFDANVANLSDVSRRLVKDARERAYSDWFSYYTAHGITDGPQRVGNCLLLLPALQTTVETAAENFHIIRFFDVCDYEKFLDEVFMY